MTINRTIAIIATYNERDNIAALAERILALDGEFRVLIVDDDSPDGTGEIVRGAFGGHHRVRLVIRRDEKGYASAMTRGFREALRWGADRILTLDADFSHDPEDLPLLASALDETPLVIGSRYLNGIRILNWSPGRLLLSLAANAYVRKVLGLPYSDCTSGFRGYRSEVIEHIVSIPIKSNGYAFLVEVLTAAGKAGFPAREIPVIYTERRAGKSKMSRLSIVEAVFLPWRIRLRSAKTP